MFVQLRRVVFLLVLLQCCACVAYAQVEFDHDKEATRTKNNLQTAVSDAYVMLAEGRSCLSFLKNEMKDSNESVLYAKKVAEDTVGILDGIEGKKNDRGKIQILLDKVRTAMGDTEDALRSATIAVGRKRAANQACHASRGNVAHVLSELEKKRQGLESYMTKGDVWYGNEECKQLVMNSTKVHGELQNVSAQIYQLNWNGVNTMTEEVKTLEGAIKTLNDAKKKLETLATSLERERTDVGRIGAIQNVTKVMGEVANNGEVQLKVVSQKPKTDMKGNEVIEGVTVKEGDTLKKIDQEKKKQMVVKAVQLKEEIFKGAKEHLRQREEVEKQHIVETIQAEEKAKKERERRVAEEKKKKEEERKKIEEQQRRVEEEKKRVEEKKKKAEEEKRKDEERKKLEEEKKKIEEQKRKAEEEKTKPVMKKDGSSGPAFVHSPLLLLLLCVLGCTLVC
ncbi:uncharacterized protein TM35_000781010 [Trypanosoma theileri]|uniref:Uncharacterized protein n=1 Tax=Trypanosoma theileri TaxID=67003 RepID=A0A1X0NEZ3_9TRYP|nr:uncharacterized protein TM35_000781010 [Trypanosoma theileri]ORC83133.1 hypothetical protein TM35_000781010 [Trypanosoma theileri]